MEKNQENNQIVFTAENGEQVTFYIVEQTKLNGINYLLVTENDEDNTNAYIMKEISAKEGTEAVYDIVEDEKELAWIAQIFEELLEDVDIVTQD